MTNLVEVQYDQTGKSVGTDTLGMRPMQARVWQRRGEQYLLIKSPPASGKSRALMFVALDKLRNQGLRQAIVVVPERSIGASFADTPLSDYGFFADWHVEPRWNLCTGTGSDAGKVDALERFLASDSEALVCTHATFRFAVDRLGVEAFDDRLIAVDEFHHVSVSDENKLGDHVRQLIERGSTHLVAMTGSYFRGDELAVLHPDDESRFAAVTYTYYEQLSGYEHLKRLDIGYYFYSGSYVDDILAVLDPREKTILHIPNVNSRESTKDKIKEVEQIIDQLGTWRETDAATGFQIVDTPGGKTLRIADLVDDNPTTRERVAAALRDPAHKHDRDHVDIIIALGMAKEGFDWIWCEHALTVGYRASLTEIVQIIGRATRDAPGKTRARFTNLIAEPDASEQAVTEAVNNTLKAIAASLLMQQVLTPKFEFRAKRPGNAATDGYDYGEGGYDPEQNNVGVNPDTGAIQVEIKGLKEPKSAEAREICAGDLTDLIQPFVQDRDTLGRGLFDDDIPPQEFTQQRMGKVVAERFPDLSEEDQEAVRQHAIAAMQMMGEDAMPGYEPNADSVDGVTDTGSVADGEAKPNTAFVDNVRKFVLSVTELDVDFIDSRNPFREAYAILAKSMDEARLREFEAVIRAKRVDLSPDEARDLARRAVRFKNERGRLPMLTAADPWERRMAEGIAYLQRLAKQEHAEG